MTTTAVDHLLPDATSEACDRCSARALVSTTFLAGGQVRGLRWCGHHFAEYEAKLRQTAVLLEVTTIGQPSK